MEDVVRTEDAHPSFIHAFHAYSPKGWTYRRGGGGDGQSMWSPSFIHAFHAYSPKGRLPRGAIYPYRREGTPRHHQLTLETPPCLQYITDNCTVDLGSYTDRQLLQYTADRAVIQTGTFRLNGWRRGGCLCFYKDISSLGPMVKLSQAFLSFDSGLV